MRISDVLYRLIGRKRPVCPHEAEILAYSENRLSPNTRGRLERHFEGCDDCREVLAFLGREVDKGVPVSEEAASERAARVLGQVRNYEAGSRIEESRPRVGTTPGISFPRLATAGLMVCAIVGVGVYFAISSRSQQQDAAMEALRLAVKDKRSTPLRISGEIEYSAYSVTRGGDRDTGDVQFSRALLKLKSAEEESAPALDRLVLARIYLARGSLNDAKRALQILEQLASRGFETAESLNDTGVAHFQLQDTKAAIEYFSRALAKMPGYNEALFNRAVAQQSANRIADARRDWEQFLSQSKDEKWNAEARNRLRTLGDANPN